MCQDRECPAPKIEGLLEKGLLTMQEAIEEIAIACDDFEVTMIDGQLSIRLKE